MLNLLLIVFGTVVVIQIGKRLMANINLPFPELPQVERPKTSLLRFFDGPNDGKVREVSGDAPSFFISQYIPTDENGIPNPDEEHMFQANNGMIYLKPNYAFYQQIDDQNFFYVRDIDEREFEKIRLTGELPVFKPSE